MLADFFARYAATEAELQEYVNGLPLWVNVWRGWMFLLFGAAILFVFRKKEARWLAVTMVVSLFAYNLMAMAYGVGRFPSIALVVFWAPLAAYFARRLSALELQTRFDRLYSWWMSAALVTLVISVAFDTYNVAHHVVTRTHAPGVRGKNPGTNVPLRSSVTHCPSATGSPVSAQHTSVLLQTTPSDSARAKRSCPLTEGWKQSQQEMSSSSNLPRQAASLKTTSTPAALDALAWYWAATVAITSRYAFSIV